MVRKDITLLQLPGFDAVSFMSFLSNSLFCSSLDRSSFCLFSSLSSTWRSASVLANEKGPSLDPT